MTLPSGQHDAQEAIATLQEATRLNWDDPYREGSLIRLPGYGQAVMTGDLHGHRRNFEKLRKYAMLDRVSARHVILHELIHEEIEMGEMDKSHEVLLTAARFKKEYPDQVHFLQSNHDLAQLTRYPIAKNGRAVIEEYQASVRAAYGETDGEAVLAEMDEFIASFALAVRTENRVWMSHSLPDLHNMEEFDPDVFNRTLSPKDLRENRTVFTLVWGRRHTYEHIESLASLLDVDVFITGHQPQEMGYALRFDRLIILASDHSHGTFLPFDLSKTQSADDLIRNIRKFVAVA